MKKRPSLRPRLRIERLRKRSRPGAGAGIDLEQLAQMPSTPERVSISCIDYGPQ